LAINGSNCGGKRIPPLVRMAALTGVDATIRAFLQKGGSPDTTDEEGRSILQIAAAKGHVSVCRLLLEAGATPLIKDNRGVDAPGAAQASGSEVVLALIRDYLASGFNGGAVPEQVETIEIGPPASGTATIEVELSPQLQRSELNLDPLAKQGSSQDPLDLTFDEDPPVDGAMWEPELEVHLGPAPHGACHSLAESVHGRITRHRAVDHDEDWSDVAIVLPVVHRGKIEFSMLGEETTAWIWRLLAGGEAYGWVPRRWVEEAAGGLENDQDKEDLKVRLEMILGEFSIQLEDETGWEPRPVDDAGMDPSEIPRDAIDFLEDLNPATRDPLAFYFKLLIPLPLLDREEERLCGRLWQIDRNPEGLRRLVEGNLRFVVKEARRFQGIGLDIQDLISEGNLGLFDAATRFDPERDIRFLTYASWWIRQRIFHALSEQGGRFRLPQKVAGNLVQLNRIIVQLAESLGREPTFDEISSEGTFTDKALERLLAIRQTTANVPRQDENGCSWPVDDQVPSSDPAQDQFTDHEDLKRQIRMALGLLNEKERDVIARHFGLGLFEPGTLEMVGQDLRRPVSRERVRQIEERALEKIMKRCEEFLKPFLVAYRPEWDQSHPTGSLHVEDQDELD